MSRMLSQVPDEKAARDVMEYLHDLIIEIMQPPPHERNKIYLPFKLDKDSPEDVKHMLNHRHVIPEHRKLMLALYRFEQKATDKILVAALRGRFYTVDASKPTDTSRAGKLGFDDEPDPQE